MEVDNPSYSDEEILKFLASKLPPDVLGAVTEFCAVELEESEYDILAKHPDLLVRSLNFAIIFLVYCCRSVHFQPGIRSLNTGIHQ
jgi:hypothetical protein